MTSDSGATPQTDATVWDAGDLAAEHGDVQCVPAHFARAQERRIAELEKDAERYRWLRDVEGSAIMRRLMQEASPPKWDKIIDAEMAKVKS